MELDRFTDGYFSDDEKARHRSDAGSGRLRTEVAGPSGQRSRVRPHATADLERGGGDDGASDSSRGMPRMLGDGMGENIEFG